MKRTALFLSVAILSCGAAVRAPAEDSASSVQYWIDQAQGWVVKTMTCDGGLCGYLVGFRMVQAHPPGYVPTDVHNPDPVKRNQPLCGLRLMGGFKPSKYEPGRWDDGWVYDPQSGSTYSGKIQQVDANTVKLRGYIAIPLFGRTLTLTRVSGVDNRCALPYGQ